MLFPYSPDSDGPARCAETFAGYFRRSTRPEVRRVVSTLEQWADDYPSSRRAELEARFQDKDERAQYSAFWELYLHQSFLRSGADVEVISPRIGETTPDFRINDGHQACYVEAVLAGPFEREFHRNRLVAAFRDELNQIQCGRWFLSLTLEEIGERAPRTRNVRKEIEEWLRSFDHSRELAECGRPSYLGHERTFRYDDWIFSISAWPRTKDQYELPSPSAIRTFMLGEMQLIETHVAIRRAIYAKARKYDLDAPLLVAVLVWREHANEDQVFDALYGSDQMTLTLDTSNLALLGVEDTRGLNGIWNDPRRGSVRALAGIVLALNLGPPNIGSCRPVLWANPFIHRDRLRLPGDLPWATCWIGADRKLAREDCDHDLHEYFGFHRGWPYAGETR